ncbi:hypothetical protein BD410DRAFT_784940 [Rickenella mellea]|uniref:Uncharacterized protein n=1 Tax=Rickenella mellea TaxID=50990 RepID=A0A4Y7QBR4_9AGAM|nr:hypothetical protein BD410DRAFT_784940 [Rickenella mellea]
MRRAKSLEGGDQRLGSRPKVVKLWMGMKRNLSRLVSNNGRSHPNTTRNAKEPALVDEKGGFEGNAKVGKLWKTNIFGLSRRMNRPKDTQAKVVMKDSGASMNVARVNVETPAIEQPRTSPKPAVAQRSFLEQQESPKLQVQDSLPTTSAPVTVSKWEAARNAEVLAYRRKRELRRLEELARHEEEAIAAISAKIRTVEEPLQKIPSHEQTAVTADAEIRELKGVLRAWKGLKKEFGTPTATGSKKLLADSSYTLDRVSAGISKLEKDIVHHTARRNQVATRLPPELLSHVFQFAISHHLLPWENSTISYPWTNLKQFMHVCQYWRTVAENCPSLWTIISSTYPPGQLDTFLLRSGACPLRAELSLQANDRGLLNGVTVAKIIHNMPRVVALFLLVNSPMHSLPFVLSLLPIMAPAMERVYLVTLETRSLPASPFGSDLPSLKDVTIQSLQLSLETWKSSLFQGLSQLHLLDVTLPFEHLLDVLRACPNIELLTLKAMRNFTYPDASYMGVVRMPSLRMVDIDIASQKCAEALSCLVLPKDVCLLLHCLQYPITAPIQILPRNLLPPANTDDLSLTIDVIRDTWYTIQMDLCGKTKQEAVAGKDASVSFSADWLDESNVPMLRKAMQAVVTIISHPVIEHVTSLTFNLKWDKQGAISSATWTRILSLMPRLGTLTIRNGIRVLGALVDTELGLSETLLMSEADGPILCPGLNKLVFKEVRLSGTLFAANLESFLCRRRNRGHPLRELTFDNCYCEERPTLSAFKQCVEDVIWIGAQVKEVPIVPRVPQTSAYFHYVALTENATN